MFPDELPNESPAPVDIVWVGDGGKQTSRLGVCDMGIDMFGFRFEVQGPLIVGMNVLKPLIRQSGRH